MIIIFQILKNPKFKYGQINRLDYGTNGTIIVAKNIDSYRAIKKQINKKKTKKVYIALVDGKMEQEHGFISLNMWKEYNNNKYVVKYSNDINDIRGDITLSEYSVW